MKLSELGQYKRVTDLELKRKRGALLEEATLSLDFANNKYEVYEGPVNGMTAKPFNEILDFTRASGATARTATGGIAEVLTDEQRLVGNREGLLIEEQRTNLVKWSGDLTKWSVQGSLTTTLTTGVFGDATIVTSGGNNNAMYDGVKFAQNTTYTIQVICRPDAGATLIMGCRFNRMYGDNRFAIVDFDALSISSTVASIFGELLSSEVTPLAGGHFYVKAVYKNVTDNTAYNSFSLLVTGSVTIDLIQMEESENASSLIPTSGTQVTRAADNCSRALGAEFNASEGTFILDVDLRGYYALSVQDQASSNNINSLQVANDNTRILIDRTEYRLDLGHGNEKCVLAVSYGSGTLAAARNGVEYLSRSFPAQDLDFLSALTLGSRKDGVGRASGAIGRVKYIPRALSEAELIALTTPEA